MAKPETVHQLLRNLGLSVTLVAGAVPACVGTSSVSENPPWVPPEGGAGKDTPTDRTVAPDNPPWTPPDAPDAGDANQDVPKDVPAPNDHWVISDNPPWMEPDAKDVGPDLPTDKVYVSENPPWVPPDAGDAKKD